MKEYILNYFPLFKCIADKCKHTCCAGWEITIDQKSLISYKQEKTNFIEKLNQGIDYKKSRFKTDKEKRCAFLNDKGLCEIIINLGEESLCQVCRDHPRFRSFFTDRVETGLGFCCEEAARIILSFPEKIEPILICDDKGEEQLDFIENCVLEFRKKALSILQNRTLSINNRIENLLKECKVDFNEKDFKKVIKTFLSFERIDKGWTKRLKSIDKTFNKTTEKDLSLYGEQFLVSGIYRHLSDAEDTMWVRARTVAVIFSWWVIKSIIKKEREKEKDLFLLAVDIVRAYSAETEYSKKNLSRLFSLCYKFINI